MKEASDYANSHVKIPKNEKKKKKKERLSIMQEKHDYLTRSKLGLRRREDCLM